MSAVSALQWTASTWTQFMRKTLISTKAFISGAGLIHFCWNKWRNWGLFCYWWLHSIGSAINVARLRGAMKLKIGNLSCNWVLLAVLMIAVEGSQVCSFVLRISHFSTNCLKVFGLSCRLIWVQERNQNSNAPFTESLVQIYENTPTDYVGCTLLWYDS